MKIQGPDWRDTLELILLAFLAGWLCKWAYGYTGHQTKTDLAVIGGTIGVAFVLSLTKPRT